MAKDVNHHCQQCITCQPTKPHFPRKVPLVSMPVGWPWQFVAVDILKVSLSTANNQYCSCTGYFYPAWSDCLKNHCRACQDFRCVWIARRPTLISSGSSKVLFCSRPWTILALPNPTKQPITHSGMASLSVLTDHCYRCFAVLFRNSMTGSVNCHWLSLHIEQQFMLPQGLSHSPSCLVGFQQLHCFHLLLLLNLDLKPICKPSLQNYIDLSKVV